MRSILATTAILLTISACKKGPEDPGLSLTSRKSRLVGEWTMQSFTATSNGTTSVATSSEITITNPDSSTLSLPYTWTMSFEREGTYTSVRTEDHPADSLTQREAFQRIIEITGEWEFTGGNGSPNKSQLLLLQTEQRTTDSDQGSNVQVIFTKEPSIGRVYDIVGLSSKDLKLKYETEYNLAFGQNKESEELILKKN